MWSRFKAKVLRCGRRFAAGERREAPAPAQRETTLLQRAFLLEDATANVIRAVDLVVDAALHHDPVPAEETRALLHTHLDRMTNEWAYQLIRLPPSVPSNRDARHPVAW